jgi:hypothetical protein
MSKFPSTQTPNKSKPIQTRYKQGERENLAKEHQPDRLIVFRLSNLHKVKDLTAHVEEETRRRILI